MNLKKNPFYRPLFMVRGSQFPIFVDVMKYPKLFKRLIKMSKEDGKEAKANMKSMLEEELGRIEDRI